MEIMWAKMALCVQGKGHVFEGRQALVRLQMMLLLVTVPRTGSTNPFLSLQPRSHVSMMTPWCCCFWNLSCACAREDSLFSILSTLDGYCLEVLRRGHPVS